MEEEGVEREGVYQIHRAYEAKECQLAPRLGSQDEAKELALLTCGPMKQRLVMDHRRLSLSLSSSPSVHHLPSFPTSSPAHHQVEATPCTTGDASRRRGQASWGWPHGRESERAWGVSPCDV